MAWAEKTFRLSLAGCVVIGNASLNGCPSYCRGFACVVKMFSTPVANTLPLPVAARIAPYGIIGACCSLVVRDTPQKLILYPDLHLFRAHIQFTVFWCAHCYVRHQSGLLQIL